MKKTLLTISLLCAGILSAQNNKLTFDNNKALQEAKARGLDPTDYAGFVKNKYNAWLIQNGIQKAIVKTSPAVSKHSHNTVSSTATNIDFETGNYTGWQLFSANNNVNSNTPLVNVLPVSAGPTDSLPTSGGCNLSDTSMRQGLMTNLYGNDPISGIPLSSTLGGNYIARVNRFCTSCEASILQQTFMVTANQPILNYTYATILEDGGHAWGEQAYFMVKMLDSTGHLLGIAGDSVYMQAANGTTPGFYPCLGGNSGATYYKPWTPVSVDLTAFVGKNVTIQVTGADCIYGGHSGYGYFDANMDSLTTTPNVWPGDANYDLVVDLNDLFYLGWAYGATGTTRANATNNWQAEPSANWGQNTVYGTEFKFADCNGDGVIDINDTAAISLNYSQTHTYRLTNANSTSALTNYRNLQITPSATSVNNNQALSLTISLPASAAGPDNLYGVAFRLNLPTQYINTLNSNDYTSFLGTNNTDMIVMCKPFVNLGYIDYCMVRKDHQDVISSGNLVGINLISSNSSITGAGTFSISKIKAVNNSGAFLPIGSSDATVNFTATTGIQTVNASKIRVMPNPASDKITLEGLTDSKATFEVVNIIGQVVLKGNLEGKSINVSSLDKGTYLLKINSQQESSIKKFIKE